MDIDPITFLKAWVVIGTAHIALAFTQAPSNSIKRSAVPALTIALVLVALLWPCIWMLMLARNLKPQGDK